MTHAVAYRWLNYTAHQATGTLSCIWHIYLTELYSIQTNMPILLHSQCQSPLTTSYPIVTTVIYEYQ